MNQTGSLILRLVASLIFLLTLTSCATLWWRFTRDKTPIRSAWLLIVLAGALPLASLLFLAWVPSASLNLFSLFWLLGIVAGLISLTVKLPRSILGVMAGLSTGCLCAFVGAFVLAALD